MKLLIAPLFLLIFSVQSHAYTRCFQLSNNQVFADKYVQPTKVICLNTWLADDSYNGDVVFEGPNAANASVSFPLHCSSLEIYQTPMIKCIGKDGGYDTLRSFDAITSEVIDGVQTYKLLITTSDSYKALTATLLRR